MADKVVKGVYEFGPYRLDATERTLTRNRQPVELTPQRFDLLLLLLRSQGRVLGKWELIKAVWHDVSNFDENNLNNAIAELRRALQDTQKPHQYIETVARRRGTRFCAPVREIGVPPTLAVLPFVPDDPAQVGNPSFGRGMDDAIITRLNKIKSLVVRPKSATSEDASSTNRTAQGGFGKSSKSKRNAPGSLGRFTRADRDPLALGHQLVVDYVLDCRIRQSGHRIRVHAKIINVRQGEPRWDELFDEYESDIFKLEDLISEQVIRVLKLKPTDEELERVTKRHTNSPGAYEKYKLGRDLRNLFTEEALITALEYFHQAIALDENYAKAYNAIADCHLWLGLYNLRPPNVAFVTAGEFVAQALERDETIAGAYTVKAYLALLYTWDFAEAETEFKRAIELNSNYTMAYLGYALLLMVIGRIEEALEELRVALLIDPQAPVLNVARGLVLYVAREYEKSVEQLSVMPHIAPNYDPIYYALAMSHLQLGQFDKAIEYAQKGKAVSHRNPLNLAILTLAYALSGAKTEAQDALNELLEARERRYVSPYHLSLACAALGKQAQAYKFLKEACELRDQWLLLWRIDPKFDLLRSDEKSMKLLQSTKLSSL